MPRKQTDLALIYSYSFPLSMPHVSDVWFALPVLGGLNRNLGPFSYRLGLRHCLGIPVYPYSSTCPRCKISRLDKLEDHAVHCSTKPVFKARHNGIWDTLVSLFIEAEIEAIKEAPVLFLNEQLLSPLRPADLLIPGWIETNLCGCSWGFCFCLGYEWPLPWRMEYSYNRQ